MVREVAEETGLIAKPKELLGIYSFTVAREGHDYHSLQIAYRSEIVGGELTFEVGGSTDMCAWHDIDLVKDLNAVELVHFALDKLQSRGA